MKKILSLTLLLLMLSASYAFSDEVKKFGIYSNEESSDGEHSVGFTVHLWEYNNGLIGLIQYQEGEIGSGPTVFIKNGKLEREKNGVTFSANLSYLGDVNFEGIVTGKMMKGSFIFANENSIKRLQILKRCCDDAPVFTDYKTYNEWLDRCKEFVQ